MTGPQATPRSTIPSTADPETVLALRRRTPVSLFVIGCSTGGPAVLHKIIPNLPADLPAPVLIVQHMPTGFVRPLAGELNRVSAVAVGVAGHREPIGGGEVWIAPANHHVAVRYRSPASLETVLSDGEPVHGCRPAVDPLAKSAARVVGATASLIVLTGMGHDGHAGAAAIRRSGGLVVAQDAESSQVYGMPRAVTEDDTAHVVLRPEAIAPFMIEATRKMLGDS